MSKMFSFYFLIFSLLLALLYKDSIQASEREYAEPILLNNGESFRVGPDDVGLTIMCGQGQGSPWQPQNPSPDEERSEPVLTSATLEVVNFRPSRSQFGVPPLYTRFLVEGHVRGNFDKVVIILDDSLTFKIFPIDKLGVFSTWREMPVSLYRKANIQVIYQGQVVARSRDFYMSSFGI